MSTKTNSQTDEAQIISDLRDEKLRRAAFSRLVQLYQEQLYWQIRKMVINHDDTADVLQNTFVKAWTNIDKFRGDSKLSTWLFTIAHHESLNFLNKMQAERDMSLDDPEGNLQNQVEADTYFDGDETQRHLLEAIASLPPRQRQAFNMRYYDEMPYEEIAQILGTTVGSLKASYHFAVERIAQYMRQFEE